MMKGRDDTALDNVKCFEKKYRLNKRPIAPLKIASVAISGGMSKVVLTQECKVKKLTAIKARTIATTC